jgi:hypothetical protein
MIQNRTLCVLERPPSPGAKQQGVKVFLVGKGNVCRVAVSLREKLESGSVSTVHYETQRQENLNN